MSSICRTFILFWVRSRPIKLVLCVIFVDCCLSLCTSSFGHCVVCPSSIYGFWLPVLYLLFAEPIKYFQGGPDQYTSLSPPLFIGVHVPSQKSEGSRLCVSGVSILLLFPSTFLLEFGSILTMLFFFLPIYLGQG